MPSKTERFVHFSVQETRKILLHIHSSKASATDLIFYIQQILEKKWEYNEAVHQLFIDFKTAYDSVRREVLYNILIEFAICIKE